MSEPLAVDIWSDIACPWCYIGKRRFEEGLRRYQAAGGERGVEVTYHSFELSPDTPVDFEGSETDFLVAHKGMPREQVAGMLAQMTELAQGVGLDYDFAAVRHTKTLKAHRLLHLAKERGLQSPMKERLLAAYFVEGRHVGHDADLVELAGDVGLDRDEVRAVLASDAYADAVQADIEQAHAYGIGGVPFYVLGGRYGVSGAQDPEVFADSLRRAAGAEVAA